MFEKTVWKPDMVLPVNAADELKIPQWKSPAPD